MGLVVFISTVVCLLILTYYSRRKNDGIIALSHSSGDVIVVRDNAGRDLIKKDVPAKESEKPEVQYMPARKPVGKGDANEPQTSEAKKDGKGLNEERKGILFSPNVSRESDPAMLSKETPEKRFQEDSVIIVGDGSRPIKQSQKKRVRSETLEHRQRTETIKLVGSIVVSSVVLTTALFIILAKYPDADKRWAFGAVGTILGYWIKK
jgi:hypothetical protein